MFSVASRITVSLITSETLNVATETEIISYNKSTYT